MGCKFYLPWKYVYLIWLVQFGISLAQLECDPTVACTAGVPGDKVVDPTDCHKYYVCIIDGSGNTVPSTLPVTCETGTYFESDEGNCTEEINPCANPCVDRTCPHNCANGDVSAFPNNCSKYYVCIPDNPPAEVTCGTAPNLYFNGVDCGSDPYACCDICTPYCATAFTEVYNPYDCHSYYLCSANNYIPTNESLFTCSAGLYFDETIPTCANETTLCSNVYLIWLVQFDISRAQIQCDPSLACTAGLPGDKVVDPTDCHKYYLCITDGSGNTVPTTLPFTCEAGTYFEPTGQNCTTETYPCANLCVTRNCLHSCEGRASGVAAFPNDCSKYYFCVPDDLPVEILCNDAPNFYFNGVECGSDPYACCDICTPYCSTAFTEVYDPYDCHSYYVCITNDYIPINETYFTCPTGQYFEDSVPTCANDTIPPCSNICTSIKYNYIIYNTLMYA